MENSLQGDDDYKGLNLTEADFIKFKHRFGFEEQQVLQYRDAFSVFDLDGDGVISVSELAQVLLALGYRPSVEEVEALIATADKLKKGCLDFPSFLHVLWKTVGVNHEEELKEVFTLFDQDSDGFVSPGELYDIMRRLGVQSTKEEAEEMIREADLNNDGLIDFHEFHEMLTSQGPHEYHSH